MNEDILIDFSYQIHDGWDSACIWLYIVFENGSAKGERDVSQHFGSWKFEQTANTCREQKNKFKNWVAQVHSLAKLKFR